MTEHSQLPTVVFVGGGFAAALMRSTLESLTSKADVIIVDEKHYTEYTVGALRGFVVPEKSAFLDVEHSHGWKKCKFIPGRLKTVKADKSIVLEDGTVLKFDVLYLATGSRYESHPWFFKEASDLIPKDARKRLKKLTIEIPKDIHVYYDTFVDLCGGLQVGIYIVDEFLAGSDGTLLRFYVEAGQRKLGSPISESLLELLSSDEVSNVAPKYAKKARKSDETALSKLREKVKDALRVKATAQAHSGQIKPASIVGHIESRQVRGLAFQREAAQIAKSDHILVIGGGFVSLEMIAEIKTIHPTKKVTVVHPTNDFFWFANKSGRARKHLNGLFKEWEIEEHAQERVVAIKQLGTSGYAVATESGKVLQADHVLVCIGIKPNSEYMREHYASTLTPNGYINVDEKLRVDPANNIFAFGDVIHFTPLPVEKMAFRAREQSGAAIANISKAVKGKTDSLESYKPDAKPFGSLPTLGYNDAILVVGDTCLSVGWIALKVKVAMEKSVIEDAGQEGKLVNRNWRVVAHNVANANAKK